MPSSAERQNCCKVERSPGVVTSLRILQLSLEQDDEYERRSCVVRNETGLLMLAAMLWVGSMADADETCRCASCGAAICKAACRTDCNKCCRCCIYFEMRVGRRAAARQLRDPDLLDVSSGSSVERRARWVGTTQLSPSNFSNFVS